MTIKICDQLYRGLSRWIGADGSHALFTRALARAQAKHDALRDIRLQERPDSCLEGIAESVRTHGESAVAGGLEYLLENVIDLLSRLIGDDVAGKLIDHSVRRASGGDGPRSGDPTNEP